MKFFNAALFCALSLSGPGLNAGAFRFFGLGSETGALELLESMRSDFGKGNCEAVSLAGDLLFKEKPSSETRKHAYKYLGACYESRGLPDRAISVYELGRGLYPGEVFFSARLAAIYLKAGLYATAAPLFKDVIENRPDDIEANAGLGKSYSEMGFLARAKDYYSRAVILGDFKDMALMKEYAWWMIKKRDWAEAELILARALKLDPGDAGIYAALSRVYSGKDDYKSAAAALSAALEREPESRSFALERALVQLLAGDAAGAAGAAADFLKDGAQDPFASLIKGLALYKKGDLAGARGALAAAGKDDGTFVARIAGALLAEINSRSKI
ncbi:MAG: tetratricopeptide repeat protein [Elusimicrobia bacterium]|nr:tetratricopeptide repeat protein [Elusimicrobiota bacterium]